MRLNINQNESANVQNNAQVTNPSNEAIESVSVGEVSLNDIQPAVIVAEEPAAPTKADVAAAISKAANGGDATTIPLGDHGTLVIGGVPKPIANPAEHAEDKPKVTLRKKTPQPEAAALPAVRLVTYKTKKGADAPLIVGFSGEDDPRWKRHFDAKPKWTSAGFRRDMEGNKVCHLMFGTRYMECAKALCDAYNTNDSDAWAKAEQACADNYNGIVAGYHAEKAARKAEREAAKAAKAAQPAAPAMSAEEKAMFEMFKKFMAGDASAIAAMNAAMKKAA